MQTRLGIPRAGLGGSECPFSLEQEWLQEGEGIAGDFLGKRGASEEHSCSQVLAVEEKWGKKKNIPRDEVAPEGVQEACGDSLLLEGKVMCAGKELSQSADKYFNTGS